MSSEGLLKLVIDITGITPINDLLSATNMK